MEQWKLDLLLDLLNSEDVQFVEDTRAYMSSAFYGKSRYHLVEHVYDRAVRIEQIDESEQGIGRVTLQEDEIADLLKILLAWYLESQRPAATPEEPLGDLDDHPF